MATPTAPTVFPLWMQWFTFVAALVLTTLKVAEVVWQTLRHGRLQVRLTRDVFLRLIDGESVFANSVLLARNGAVLINDVELKLSKLDGAKKDYPLIVMRVGERVRGTTPLGDLSFLTTSPLAFIPALSPQRLLYLAAHPTYSAATDHIMEEFRNWARITKEELLSNYAGNYKLISEDERNRLLKNWRANIQEFVTRYMEQVQMESGKYRLGIEVSYSPVGLLSFTKRRTASSITFELPHDIRDRLRRQMPDVFEKTLLSIVSGETSNIIYPEISLLQAKEE
jgi:hypothetical protein